MKRTKLTIAMLALVLPFLLSLACGSTLPPGIGEVVTAKSLDENFKPVDAISSYMPEDTFYVSVQVTDLIVGSVVKVQYKLDGEVYEESTLTADQAGSGYYGFSLAPDEYGHTPGSYTAEVYLDNVLVKTVNFTVEGDVTAKITDVVIAESLNSDGSPVNPRNTFKPTDVVGIAVLVNNVKVGSEVKIIYTYEGQTQEQTTTASQSGSGYFGFTFSPSETGHAIGEYTVEAFLDGVAFGTTVSFTIAE
jgi:hypothetical protein